MQQEKTQKNSGGNGYYTFPPLYKDCWYSDDYLNCAAMACRSGDMHKIDFSLG